MKPLEKPENAVMENESDPPELKTISAVYNGVYRLYYTSVRYLHCLGRRASVRMQSRMKVLMV